MLIMNVGTQPSHSATLENAELIAREIERELGITLTRDPRQDDPEGWFGYQTDVLGKPGEKVDLAIPGDNPEEFFESRPFLSRRMYVAGSSWWWTFAASRISERCGLRYGFDE